MKTFILLLLAVIMGVMGGCVDDPLTDDVYTTGNIYVRYEGEWVALSPGGSGNVSWGGIPGTLSDQLDLQTALDAKEATDNKGVANGYAPLDGSILIVPSFLGSGVASESTYLRGDQTWQELAGGGDMTKAVYDIDGDSLSDKAEYVDDGEGNTSTAADVKGAVDDAHTHVNKVTLDDIEEAFRTALKMGYDWLVANFTEAWKILVDEHLSSSSNPHGVDKTDVGLSNVTDDAQIAKTLVEGKGDIISATSGTNPVRLPVGNDGDVLTVDSSTTTGLKWSAPAGGGGSVEYKAGTVTTDGSGLASVVFNTNMSDINYSIQLTAVDSGDTVVCMFASKSVGGFNIKAEDDGGKDEANVVVNWLAIAYFNP